MLAKLANVLIAFNSFYMVFNYAKKDLFESPEIDFFSTFEMNPEPKRKTQMKQYVDKIVIKVAVCNGSAYWVHNNLIYKADIDDNGKIHNDEASVVDVFSLSEKEVSNLLEIIDSISQ